MSALGPDELYATDIDRRMNLSMAALAVFEYITTFDQEVSSIWKRRQSGASLLLFAVRYTMVATMILDPPTLTTLSFKECMGFLIAGDVLLLFSFILPAVFSALRVYALCGRSMMLCTTVFCLQLAPFAANLYGIIRSTYDHDVVSGCTSEFKFGSHSREVLTLMARIPLIVGDALVVIVTWKKSLQQLRMQRNLGLHLPLSALMFRDGTVYFLLLLIFNILELCPLTSVEGGIIIASLNANLPLILINRFMMNLRNLSDSEERSAGHVCTISTSLFRITINITGNMGEPLEHVRGAKNYDESDVEVVLHDTGEIELRER